MHNTDKAERADADASGTVSIRAEIPAELHRRIRVGAFTAGQTLQEWIIEAASEHLRRRGRA